MSAELANETSALNTTNTIGVLFFHRKNKKKNRKIVEIPGEVGKKYIKSKFDIFSEFI